jgi:hypothetical protein
MMEDDLHWTWSIGDEDAVTSERELPGHESVCSAPWSANAASASGTSRRGSTAPGPQPIIGGAANFVTFLLKFHHEAFAPTSLLIIRYQLSASISCIQCHILHFTTKLRGLSPRANYTDGATAACRPTAADRGCHVVSATDPYGRTLGFLDRSATFPSQ